MLMIYNYFNSAVTQVSSPPIIQSDTNLVHSLDYRTPGAGVSDNAIYKKEYLATYKKKYDEYYKQYYDSANTKEFGRLLDQVNDPSISQKEAEYVNKLYRKKYGHEEYVMRQDIAYERDPERSQQRHYDLSYKMDLWRQSVRAEAREIAIREVNPTLFQQLLDQAAAYAAQEAPGWATWATEKIAENAAQAAASATTVLKPAVQKTVAIIQNNLNATYYSELLGYGAMTLTALAALGIYTMGTTKNLFTVVKQENVPAHPFGIFLTKPLLPTDINTINTTNNTIFHTVSDLNRSNFTVINKFQRSFLMTIADRARRLASALKK